MKYSRKMQRMHELQVVRSIKSETGKVSLTSDKRPESNPTEAEGNPEEDNSK